MTICDAINHRHLVRFNYDGHERVVIPAAYGRQVSTHNEVLRGYQIGGTSKSRVPPLWDLFLVGKMLGFTVLEETFDADPPGYNRGDQYIDIQCQL